MTDHIADDYWHPHDAGSEHCGCHPIRQPVIVRYTTGATKRLEQGSDLMTWAGITAWCYATAEARAKNWTLEHEGWFANSGQPPKTTSPMARVTVRRRNKQEVTDMYAWFGWTVRDDPYDIILYKFVPPPPKD